jgi:hypothetical protein
VLPIRLFNFGSRLKRIYHNYLMDHYDLKNYIIKFLKSRRARSGDVSFKYDELKDRIGDEMREYIDDLIDKNLIIMKKSNETKVREEEVKNATQSPSLFEF